MAEDMGEKTEAPTGRKLGEARERGQVVKSTDLAAAIDLAAVAIILVLLDRETSTSGITCDGTKDSDDRIEFGIMKYEIHKRKQISHSPCFEKKGDLPWRKLSSNNKSFMASVRSVTRFRVYRQNTPALTGTSSTAVMPSY